MSGVGSQWVSRLDGMVERLTDDLTALDVRQSASAIQHFLEHVEAPPDTMHGAVLSSVLMDLCCRIVKALHAQNPPAPCRCESTIWSHIGRFNQWREQDPRAAFGDWVRSFFADLDTQHPPDSALAAAAAIRDDPTRTWTLDALAELVQTRPQVLRREFEIRYGMRPASYVQLTRVTRAIALLRTTAKVEAVAWDVGYKSKKDLYAALSRWADSTPTAIRALSAQESAWLERQLRIQCARGIATDAERRQFFNAADETLHGGAHGSADRPGSRR